MPIRKAIIKKSTITNAGEDMEEKEPSATLLVGMWVGTATVENSMKVSQKIKRELPYHPAITLLGIYSDKTMVQKSIHTPMFIAALFTIVKIWKKLKCPMTDEWIKMPWYIHTMEYYSVIKIIK